jgi:hypothetical protein
MSRSINQGALTTIQGFLLGTLMGLIGGFFVRDRCPRVEQGSVAGLFGQPGAKHHVFDMETADNGEQLLLGDAQRAGFAHGHIRYLVGTTPRSNGFAAGHRIIGEVFCILDKYMPARTPTGKTSPRDAVRRSLVHARR